MTAPPMLADLEKYATAADPYVIVVASAITMDPKGKVRPQLTDAQAAGQSVANWLGDWTPTAS
ncbi:hypothetical protein OG762_23975 [Streptomyces sp. NBC_01136]|uniref:hypothetical protein n=1 Tax=unclassified Streptomyces TaxID=2593676 RepID=UPI0032449D65|nr:hypothetical protein OG762_23975 [Streptomyces sp. NBC_01136]